MNNDEGLVLNKILDKAKLAKKRNTCTHTDFLDLYEQTIFNKNINLFNDISYEILGGYNESERKIVLFNNNYLTDSDRMPYDIIRIESIEGNSKLSHRDYLGAVLNLGITRSKIGDIVVCNKYSYLICLENITEFIVDNLFIVKNTSVKTSIIDKVPIEALETNHVIINCTVASLRLDNIVKAAWNLSRNNAVDLIKGSKVYTNGMLNINISSGIKAEDIISVRGFGKFKVNSIGNITKKGRIYIEIKKYV